MVPGDPLDQASDGPLPGAQRTVLKLEDRHCMVIQRDVGHNVAYTTRDVGQYLVVEASIGVIVIWDRKTTIFIKLDPSYKVRSSLPARAAQARPGPAPSLPRGPRAKPPVRLVSAGCGVWPVREL